MFGISREKPKNNSVTQFDPRIEREVTLVQLNDWDWQSRRYKRTNPDGTVVYEETIFATSPEETRRKRVDTIYNWLTK